MATCRETAVHLAVAGGVFDGVFCAVLFPLDVLDETLDLIESVAEGFLTYSWINYNQWFLIYIYIVIFMVMIYLVMAFGSHLR